MLVAVTLEQVSDVASPLTWAFLREDALLHLNHRRRNLDHNQPAPCRHSRVVERRMDSHLRLAPWGSRMSHLPHHEQEIPSTEMPVS